MERNRRTRFALFGQCSDVQFPFGLGVWCGHSTERTSVRISPISMGGRPWEYRYSPNERIGNPLVHSIRLTHHSLLSKYRVQAHKVTHVLRKKIPHTFTHATANSHPKKEKMVNQCILYPTEPQFKPLLSHQCTKVQRGRRGITRTLSLFDHRHRYPRTFGRKCCFPNY